MSLADEVQKIMDTAIEQSPPPTVEDRLGKRPEDHFKTLHGAVDGLGRVVVLLAQEIDALKGAEPDSQPTLN